MDTKEILKKVETLVVPVFANLGCRLIEREFLMDRGQWVLRLYIDKEGGVTIADCERASRAVEDLIEVEEVVPVRYSLEVSSPGIERPIRYPEDFERCVGSKVSIKTSNPIGDRRNFKGILTKFDGGELDILIDGVTHKVPFADVAKAKLKIGS